MSNINEQILVAKELAEILNDKKANDVVLMNVSQQSQFADIFVIVSGQSLLHLHGLQSTIVDFLATKGYKKKNPSNMHIDSPWLLLDFGDFVIHLFTQEAREFYNLEKLWKDSPVITVE